MDNRRILFEAPKLALTRVEAADALDVSPATLDRLVKRGLLRPSRALRRGPTCRRTRSSTSGSGRRAAAG